MNKSQKTTWYVHFLWFLVLHSLRQYFCWFFSSQKKMTLRLVDKWYLRENHDPANCVLIVPKGPIEMSALIFSNAQTKPGPKKSGNVHSVGKLLKMSHLHLWILAFSTNFCPIKTDLSGNTVWPQASGFQKLAKMDHFWHF